MVYVHKKGRIEEDVSTIGSDAITFLSTVGGVTILATTSQYMLSSAKPTRKFQ